LSGETRVQKSSRRHFPYFRLSPQKHFSLHLKGEWDKKMRVVVQRSKEAKVTVEGEVVGQIQSGLVLLFGVTHEDTEQDAMYLAEKIAGLRIFEDADGKMNLSLLDVGGQVLSVSQFTL
jgi:hypothetical protein